MKKLLIVDDSAHMRAMIRLPLKKAGYDIVGEAKDGKEALLLYNKLNPDIVLLDNILPDMFGVDVLKSMKQINDSAKIIMISSIKKESVITKLIGLGAFGYIVKPFEPVGLVNTVNAASPKSRRLERVY